MRKKLENTPAQNCKFSLTEQMEAEEQVWLEEMLEAWGQAGACFPRGMRDRTQKTAKRVLLEPLDLPAQSGTERGWQDLRSGLGWPQQKQVQCR